MGISSLEFDQLLKLSCLFMSDEEKSKLHGDFDLLLDFVSKLDDCVGSDSAMEYNGMPFQKMALRDDEVVDEVDLNPALNAPDWEDGYFSVPGILAK